MTSSVKRIISLTGYDIHVGSEVLDELPRIVAPIRPHRIVVISDANVAALYGKKVAHMLGGTLLTIPAGERSKSRDEWARLTDEMLALGAGRDSLIVAVGGGVAGDLAGFVAATYLRGIPIIQVPTSLLAMIDSSVGGKTGVDVPAGKNLVGAFHRPAAVVADIDVLSTLPARELRAGAAEAFKHGVIADDGYFELVSNIFGLTEELTADIRGRRLTELVSRSIEIKADVVESDELEAGRRQILNFGHTVGHAIEHVSGYSLLHGEAIAIGMVIEARIGEAMGVTQPGVADTIREAFEKAGLPTASVYEPEPVFHAMEADKKAVGGAIMISLPKQLGAMNDFGGRWTTPAPKELILNMLRP